MLAGILAAPASADDAANREYQVKVAMLVNFAHFVEWPQESFPASDSPLIIATVGANPFGNVLEQLVAGKTIAGHSIKVVNFPTAASMDNCHLLFVPRSEDADLGRVMQKIAGKPVLSVGDSDSFVRSGGVVRFYTEDNKVRFEINSDAAERVKLKISSKLLKLAKIVTN